MKTEANRNESRNYYQIVNIASSHRDKSKCAFCDEYINAVLGESECNLKNKSKYAFYDECSSQRVRMQWSERKLFSVIDRRH